MFACVCVVCAHVEPYLAVARRDDTALVLPGLSEELQKYKDRQAERKRLREEQAKQEAEAAVKAEAEAEAEAAAEAEPPPAEDAPVPDDGGDDSGDGGEEEEGAEKQQSAEPAPEPAAPSKPAPEPAAEEQEEEKGLEVVPMTPEARQKHIRTPEFARLAQSLTPPDYCKTAVNGDKAFPTTGKPQKGVPTAKAALKIAEQMIQERKCWFVDKKCANDTSPDMLSGGGKLWVRKFMSQDRTLESIWENLPDFAPGELGTCALIGSADNMLKKGWGAQIDAHDFVVRFNSVMKGFEKDIGAKTDGLWMKDSYKGAIGGKQIPTKMYMIPKSIPKNFEMKNGVKSVAYGPALPKWRKAIQEIYNVYKKDKNIKKGTPTGGLARMISLMESGACTRVDIYGYSGGGGKYFKKNQVVKDEHIISVEHYIRRLMMATGIRGKVCVYGQ